MEANIQALTLQETPLERSTDFHPTTFEEYLGQASLKKKLSLYTQAAHLRNEPLDHLLLFGPPGLGKTTLANIMAHTMDVGIKICNGPMLERAGDLVAILSSLEPRDILFIDEIHRMPRAVEETLYSAMEHFRIDIIIGQGAGAKAVNLPISQFTLVGATTQAGRISAPLRSRFGIVEQLQFYMPEELTEIILQNARFLELKIDPASAARLAACSRGTPRIAKKLLRRIRDFAQVTNKNHATKELVEEALEFLGIDQEGLTMLDRKIIQTITEHFNGGPVGLDTIASLVGEDRQTLEDVYEPFLMRQGYLERTPRGRQITRKKLAKLKTLASGQKTVFKN